MSRLASWGLIGFGSIGHEVVRQLAQTTVAARLGLESAPRYIITTDGICEADGQTVTPYKTVDELPTLPHVTFVAIPSSDDGNVAYDYIMPLLRKGKMVVTAEKGALVNHFAELKQASDNFSRFGVTATVGGGTRMMQVADAYCQDISNIAQIHLVLNGTLTAMLDWVSPLSGPGISLEQAARQAVAEKYAEPGSSSPVAIIRAEAESDIPKKLAIFYNSLGFSDQPVDWNELRFSLSDTDISAALNSPIPRRFIASLYSPSYVKHHEMQANDNIIGGLSIMHDGWQLKAGFRQVDANPLFSPLASLSGPGNGIVISLGPEASDGVYAVTGPGAGVNPTVNTMLDDFIRLNAKHKSSM